jgi:hypothetical protein
MPMLLVLLGLSSLHPGAWAVHTSVQCQSSQVPLRAQKAAEAVFVGEVLGFSEASITRQGDTIPARIHVRMLQSLKGPTADTLAMLRPDADAYPFELGKTYLIFARYVGP